MRVFDLSINVLTDVIDNDEYFNEALRKIFQKNIELRPLRKDVAALVGCELRHHLLFEYLLYPFKDNLSKEDIRTIEMALSNNYFVDLLDAKEVNKTLLKRLGEEKFLLILPILENAHNYDAYIPKTVSRTSNRYLTLRFNTPEWVLKVWQTYGYGPTYKILKCYSLPPITYIRFGGKLKDSNKFLKEHKDFKRTDVPCVYRYYGRQLRDIEEYKNGSIYLIKPGIKNLIDTYRVSSGKTISVFNGNRDDSIFREIIESYSNKTDMVFSVPNIKEHPDITTYIKNEHCKNVKLIEVQNQADYEKLLPLVDMMVCYPDSTNFDLIPYYPDYLMHFKKGNKINKVYDEQINSLESCASRVKDGGTLIYVVSTISKKEGSYNILNFLANHREFKLVKEEQRFPFDELSTGMYYCVMKKDRDLKIDPLALKQLEIEKAISSTATKLEGQKINGRK